MFVIIAASLFIQSVVTCVHRDRIIFIAIMLYRWYLRSVYHYCCIIIHAICSFLCLHREEYNDCNEVAEVVLEECLSLLHHIYAICSFMCQLRHNYFHYNDIATVFLNECVSLMMQDYTCHL